MICGVNVRTIYRWKQNETINRVIQDNFKNYIVVNEHVSDNFGFEKLKKGLELWVQNAR